MKKVVGCALVLVLLFCLQPITEVQAATKYVSSFEWNKPVKVGGVTFEAKRQKVGTVDMSRITMKRNGKKKTILSKVEVAFATNGSELYYTRPKKITNDDEVTRTIYCMNLKTGKSKKVAKGKRYEIVACSGTYLYIGSDNIDMGINLYALNPKTKKQKHMADWVRGIYFSSSRVITSTAAGDVDNYPIYSFKTDGSGKIKIVDAVFLSVKKGKIYYAKYNLKTDKYKVYSCSNTGKSKKALTGWSKTISSKYYQIGYNHLLSTKR